MYGISRILVSKCKNKCKLVKKVLPHLSVIYFITQGRGAQIFVCYVRPEVNTKKGLGEGVRRGKGNVAIYWRSSGFSLCIQLIFFSPTFGLADSFSPLVAHSSFYPEEF